MVAPSNPIERIVMIRVRMLETKPGSPNGIVVNTYHKGNVYELPDELAMSFLSVGHAELVEFYNTKGEALPVRPPLRDRIKAFLGGWL